MRFLFVDRITELEPRGLTRGIKHVTPDDYYLMLDARTNKRCFMPALVGETVGQLAAWNVMSSTDFKLRPVAGIVEQARVHRPVYVGESIALESHITNLDDSAVQYFGEARVNNELVFELTGALGPMLPMREFIDEQQVRAQFHEVAYRENFSAFESGPALEEPNSALTIDPRVASLIQFDRVIAHEPKISIEAEKRITRAAAYFPDHFPTKPVLPMTILLECIMSLGRDFVASGFEQSYVVKAMRRIKMNDFVIPGDVLCTKLSLTKQTDDELTLRARVSRGEKRVCLLELVMAATGENTHA